MLINKQKNIVVQDFHIALDRCSNNLCRMNNRKVLFVLQIAIMITVCEINSLNATMREINNQKNNSEAEIVARKLRERRSTSNVPKSKIIDAMLKTPMFRLNPAEPDIFHAFRDKYDLPKGFKGPLEEYDFIIVGAGSAGCVLAARLTESREATVLLLEAGRGESMMTDMPIAAPLLQQTDYVWHYLMEPQPGVCKGFNGERCFWPRGKAIGGTSVVNYMIYTRGMPADWDRIAADGNNGWSYKDVLPYYLKSERANLRGLNSSQMEWHGRDGELPVEYVPWRSKLSKVILEASKHMGNRRVDYNSPDGFGFSYIQATMTQGRRFSSAKAFLHRHKTRKNLHVLPSTTATKVLIDPKSKIAYGIEFFRNGKYYRVRARKEVILSAGPIESPHLLMLSGVGPKNQLKPLGIPVIKDLKVGEVLYDHISFPGLTFLLNTTNFTLLETKAATVDNIIAYNTFGDGPFTSLVGVETIGYIKTNASSEIGNVPDIEILGTCASLASDEGNAVAKGIHLADWLYDSVYKPIENIDSFAVFFMLLHPKSKGSLKLRSANPFEQPKLYGNYLTEPEDIRTVIEAIRYIIRLVDTPPFKKYGAQLHDKKFPNCQFQFGSDSYWECAVRTMTATLHHQIATCKMGPETDPFAVVDPSLKVYGIKRLRVVDSSVIPRTIAAHTNAPAIMIGEKGADMIKRTWGLA